MNSFNHQLFKIPKNCRETEKKKRKNLHFYKMKNHQFSKISKKKQRKVSIIILYSFKVKNTIKDFQETTAKEKEEKNSRYLPSLKMNNTDHRFILHSFQERNEKT